MAIVRLQRILSDIGASSSADYQFTSPTIGGILLDMTLTWRGRQYYDLGTADEVAKLGDIHVIIGDSATNQSVIGQILSPLSAVRVPTGGDWSWSHPHRDELVAGAAFISRLTHKNWTPMPVGVIRNDLRIIASWDPLVQQQHDLIIEANLMPFALSVI